MKTILLPAALAALFLSFDGFSAVRPDENLVTNGRLEADQSVLPSFWISNTEKNFSLQAGGGPNGLNCVSVLSDAKQKEISLRQFGLRLTDKGRYRIVAWVRTRNFVTRRCGIGIANNGWKGGRDVGAIPRDTNGRWVRLENEFSNFKSEGGRYFFYVYTQPHTGSLDIADLALYAVDEAACRETELSGMNQPHLLPITPLLWRIPKDDPRVTFKFYGSLPNGTFADYEGVLRVEGAPERRATLSADGSVVLPFPSEERTGAFTVAVIRRADGKEFANERRTYRVRDVPRAISAEGHRVLNNLVTEVLAAKVREGANAFAFTTVRDGWIFASVRGEAKESFRVVLDSRIVMDRATPRHEMFRFIEAGEHALSIEGAGTGSVTVRSIAEIFNYCPGVSNKVSENPPYDWAYQAKYGLPAITTENGGLIPQKERAAFHASGRLWLANVSTAHQPAATITRRIAESAGMTAPYFDGITCDEQAFSEPDQIMEYTKGLKAYDFANNPEHLIYTWAIAKPTRSAVDTDFILTAINASRGRGHVLSEAYLGTQETEEEARQKIQLNVLDRIASFRLASPLVMPSLGFALGNFNQVPILSIAHHPEVDYKYYLDMQMHALATDPVCRGIGTVGYWGSYYADDELHRWSYALLRHYAVEGHTNMLSAAYGFRYRPDLVLNGDFRGTFAPWTVSGDVKLDSHAGFAVRSQNRWFSRGGVGDTFAALTRTTNGVASLKQTVRGLVPGRMYCLQFATFDVNDVKTNALHPRRFAIEATLSDGAEVVPSLSWCHIDKRTKGRYANNDGVARINLRHIVFTARAREVTLTLDNATAQPGEVLGVNYLSVNPYYP